MSLITKYKQRTRTRTIATNEDDHLVELGITEHNHCPSWKRFGHGSFNIEFMGHKISGGVSLTVVEHNHDNNTSRQVMANLDRAEARALRDMLNKMNLGEKGRLMASREQERLHALNMKHVGRSIPPEDRVAGYPAIIYDAPESEEAKAAAERTD